MDSPETNYTRQSRFERMESSANFLKIDEGSPAERVYFFLQLFFISKYI